MHKMKWSEIPYPKYWMPFDENQRAIRGFFLTTLNLNLESLPYILNQPFRFIDSNSRKFTDYTPRKVYLKDIIGTTYKDYGDLSIVQSFMRLKRAAYYISKGRVSRGKYSRMLKRPVKQQSCPVMLSYNPETGEYWVDGNGNHRVVLYKIMMLAEIAEKSEWARSEDFDLGFMDFDVTKRYWLNALVRDTL